MTSNAPAAPEAPGLDPADLIEAATRAGTLDPAAGCDPVDPDPVDADPAAQPLAEADA